MGKPIGRARRKGEGEIEKGGGIHRPTYIATYIAYTGGWYRRVVGKSLKTRYCLWPMLKFQK